MSNNRNKFWSKKELNYIAQKGGMNIKSKNKKEIYNMIKKKYNISNKKIWFDMNKNELKKFNTHDGMAFKILKEKGIFTAMITSEKTNIVKLRASKLQVDYLFQGVKGGEKLEVLKKICIEKNMSLSEVAYIGDDINDYNVLSSVGFPACPKNAIANIKSIKGITHLSKSGGDGAVREFVELLLNE